MDELTMFAELRPDDNLTAAELRAVRAEVFPGLEQSHAQPIDAVVDGNADADDVDVVVVPFRVGGGKARQFGRRPRSRVAVAAAAIVAVGVGGLWVAADRQGAPESTAPAAQPPSSVIAVPDQVPGVYDMPLVGFAEPGWTVVNVFETTLTVDRAIVFLGEGGFDGPWVEITANRSGAAPVATVPPGDSSVDVLGQAADVTMIEDGVIVRWRDASGNSIEAFGWQTDLDQLTAVANSVDLAGIGVTIDPLPAGATLGDAAATDALSQYASYRFTHVDGREVEVTLTPGGARGLYQRQGATTEFDREGRTEVMIGDEPATIVDYTTETVTTDPPGSTDTDASGDAESQGGVYRVDIQRGFWTWEFNTARFASPQHVLELVAGSATVDADTWRASLSESIVTPDERPDAIAAMLAGVPLPSGFETADLLTPTTADRYQFIAEVSGAVVCGWLSEWVEAGAAGDAARLDAAAAAIATSRDWPMLTEIADQGDWAEVVWGLADHVNADPVDATPVSTPEQVASTFDCQPFN